MSFCVLNAFESNGVVVSVIEGQIINESPRSIVIEPTDTNDDISIITTCYDDIKLKSCMLKSPVIPEKEIKLYSFEGNLINKWSIDRKNNSHGNIMIPRRSSSMFSDIKFDNYTGNVYLICPPYHELDSCTFDKSKIAFAKMDLDRMRDNIMQLGNKLKVTLIISQGRFAEFKYLGININQYFSQFITVPDDDKKCSALTEIICGKMIGGSVPTFDISLCFGQNVQILDIKHISTKLLTVNVTCRTKGRIGIAGSGDNVSLRFICTFKYTGQRPEFITYKNDSFPFNFTEPTEIPHDVCVTASEIISYYFTLKELENSGKHMEFILSSPKTVLYTYTNPILCLDNMVLNDEISQALSLYFVDIYNTLSSSLNSLRSGDSLHGNKRQRLSIKEYTSPIMYGSSVTSNVFSDPTYLPVDKSGLTSELDSCFR